jgi:hypothetical protein
MRHLNLVHNRLLAVVFSLIGLVTGLFMSSTLFAHPAFNVGLSRFEAIPEMDGMHLEWDVESEIGTAGYTIKRGIGANFDYLFDPETDNNLFIVAEGGPSLAVSYSFIDETAVPGETYTYQLFEVTSASGEQMQDEVTISYQVEATNTPVTFSGNSGNEQNNNAPTSTPGATVVTTVAVSTPVPAASEPTTSSSSTSPQAENTTANEATAQNNGAPAPPATNENVLEAYPGSATVVQEEQAVDTSGGQAAETANSVQELEQPESADQALDAPAANVYPGAINALEDPGNAQRAESVGNPTPVVIRGMTAQTIDDNTYPSQPQEEQVPENVDSSRILLWLAFLVALIIFTASVVGAIFLYNKQRSV